MPGFQYQYSYPSIPEYGGSGSGSFSVPTFESIMGNKGAGTDEAAIQDLNAAANVMDEPAGATPEESQADAIDNPEQDDFESILNSLMDEQPEESMFEGEEDEDEDKKKPFGDEEITEDEAVEMARK